MALTQLAPPYPIFTDKNGDPLDAGFLYFGVVDLNPETNPIQVYWDNSLTQPAAQPIRTINGYPSRNGSPAAVYTNDYFSVTVRNKKSELVIYAPSGYGITPGTSASFTGQMTYNEGSAGAVDRTLTSRLQDYVSVKDFGAVGDGVTDDTVALEAAWAYCASQGAKLLYPKGTYIHSGSAVIMNFGQFSRSLLWEGDDATINFTKLDTQYLQAWDPKIVDISGINFVGPAAEGPSPSEFHFGLAIYGCERGSIRNCSFTGFIGDGLLISGFFDANPDQRRRTCRNLSVNNCYFNNNGRGGLTIVSADAMSVFSNTFGPDTLATAIVFPGLHIEADPSDRYPIGTLDVFNNTIQSYVTLINPLQANTTGDANSRITIRDNLIDVSTQIAFSGPGCGNVSILNNTIRSTFSGTPNTNVGLFWLKGGNITIENNIISATNAQHIFSLTYWKSLGVENQALKVSNNCVTYTQNAAFNATFRIFGDNGIYSNSTWDCIDISGRFDLPSTARFLSINPGSSAVTANIKDVVFGSATINLFMSFGTNIPASTRIRVDNVTVTATGSAFDTPNFVNGAILVKNSRIVGSFSGAGTGITSSGSTVIPQILAVTSVTDGSGVPSPLDSNLPGFYNGALVKVAAGVYEVSGLTIGMAFTLLGSASIFTNANAEYSLQFSRATLGVSDNLRLLSYSGGVLTDLPANAVVFMKFDTSTSRN